MTAVTSRPGPRADLDVRDSLLSAAERMFGDQGVSAVSLRAIGREAGVSSAGVLYHFPSKPALVAAVVRRRGERLGREVRARFGALLDSTVPLTTRDVVDAILEPTVAMINADPAGGLSWMKVVSELARRDDEGWAGQVGAQRELFAAAALRALPDFDSIAVRARVGIAMHSMLTTLAGADLGSGYPQLGPAGLDEQFVEQLATFTAAGMAAR